MTWRIHPRLAWQSVDGETVVVDVEAGRVFGLRGVAASLWPLLEGHDTAELAQEIVRRYEVDAETARLDTEDFLAELRERRLILEA